MIRLGRQAVEGLPAAALHREAVSTDYGEDVDRDSRPLKPPGESQAPWVHRDPSGNRNMNPNKPAGIAQPKQQQGGNPS